MNVVVVESPAKAKAINKYLGPGYRVVASYGHVRDLPAKEGSVRPDEDFAMSWEVDGRAEPRLKEIAKALKGASQLILATDPDREGEAISWHIMSELERRHALKGIDVKRVVFHEITRSAVLDAMANPRALNKELIDAYLARRALDYLVGFTLSPVLWRKLPGSRSAGRVQSVALRLICEREAEIEAFQPREYWTVEAAFATAKGENFKARLTQLDGRKLEKFDLGSEEAAGAAVARLNSGAPYRVAAVERKTVRRNPYPPFITSTLQQEASRKLGLGASATMRLAQRLYEGIDLDGETVGLITYMRTDGVQLSNEAVDGARKLIAADYGKQYLPEAPRRYKSTAKNAQEAHEAIRPTDLARRPRDLAGVLDREQLRLYELIWKRTIACQMESAVIDQVAVDVDAKDGVARLRVTGSTIRFDGFLTLYQEDRDDPAEDENGEGRLPALAEGQAVDRGAVTPAQHFTEPPPRFSEASLVKRLEELGIGRPSTYASIIQVLQDRDYVRIDKRRFIPEDRGRIVTAFLSSFFERYVQYNFTAELENELDDVSGGRTDWKSVLRNFWGDFIQAVEGTRDLRIGEVIDTLDAELGPHFFPPHPGGGDSRACPTCTVGRLNLKLGKFGAFIGCSTYPECRYTRRLAIVNGNGEAGGELEGPKLLGLDPVSGLPVSLRVGPYGPYAQLGDAVDKKEKPKRVSLPKGTAPDTVDLAHALGLLALPREIGKHPETGHMIAAGVGRFGPYLKHDGKFRSLAADDSPLTIGLNRAVDVLAQAPSRPGRIAGKPVGDHPDGGTITLHSGRYGPYVRHGKVLASLSKSMDPDTLTVEAAAELLAARAAKSPGGGKKAKPKRKAPRAKAKKK